jgi:4a-hydroxytetrahydrobiopterin dehydratase
MRPVSRWCAATDRRRNWETLAGTGCWEVVDNHHLKKSYRFSNFREAQSFVNCVGDLAEEQGHHPDICFGWGQAEFSIWTHKIDGLTESDFILAAKIDELSVPIRG